MVRVRFTTLMALMVAGSCQRLPAQDDDDAGVSISGGPGTTGDGGGGTFLESGDAEAGDEADDGAPQFACDPVAQTGCTSGEKCTAIKSGGNLEYACVADTGFLDPLDACQPALGSGVDGCPPGYFCLAGEAEIGLCVAHCTNNADCSGLCLADLIEQIPSCADHCSPFETTCPVPQQCRRIGDRFVCQFLTEGDIGGAGDTCSGMIDGGCATGFACIAGALISDCTDSHCCAPLCDLGAAEACESPASCSPVLEGPAPGFEDIGACFVPS